jgi:hypothetical protein
MQLTWNNVQQLWSGATSQLIECTMPAKLQPRNNVLLNILRMQWQANYHNLTVETNCRLLPLV